jgi:asparagine synthetase A
MILEHGEVQDEVLIKQLGEEIQDMYPGNKNRVNVFLYVYRMEREQREILVDLFKDKDRTQNHFEIAKGGLDFSDMYTTRTDHEGFKFLDVYGERDEYMYEYYPNVVNFSQEEFIERCKNHDIWRD